MPGFATWRTAAQAEVRGALGARCQRPLTVGRDDGGSQARREAFPVLRVLLRGEQFARGAEEVGPMFYRHEVNQAIRSAAGSALEHVHDAMLANDAADALLRSVARAVLPNDPYQVAVPIRGCLSGIGGWRAGGLADGARLSRRFRG